VPPREIVVIGASAGGIEALRELVAGLSPDLAAAFFVVVHIPPDYPSYLPEILSYAGPLPVVEAADGDPIEAGRIMVAPSDHHMLVERGHVTVARGPKENLTRPSVDPLFRSAAHAYGARVIGVLLSGNMSDGVSGLWTIKHFGGLAILQSPEEAKYPSMPLNALAQVEVDYSLPVAEMPALIERLLSEPVFTEPAMEEVDKERLDLEVSVARNDYAFDDGLRGMGAASIYSCPECHGVLQKIDEGPLIRFRCHTGHAFTPEALIAGVARDVDTAMIKALRALQESVMLLEQLGNELANDGQPETGKEFLRKAQEARKKASALHELIERRA
jgi:two-component system chemotaxis response regulator CheB